MCGTKVGVLTQAARKIQIKGRSLSDNSKLGQRVGVIKSEREWDSIILVLMDDVFTIKDM